MGFHAALVLGAAAFWWTARKREHLWWLGWIALSFAGVALGARFFPRYYLQLLPALVLLAACGLARRRSVAVVAAVTVGAAMFRDVARGARDLDGLLAATRRVQDGDYGVRLGRTRSNLAPIQELGRGFDTMVTRLGKTKTNAEFIKLIAR